MYKKLFFIVSSLLFLNGSLLYGLKVPYAKHPLQTNENLIQHFYRVSPPDSHLIELDTKAWLWHDDKSLYVHFEVETDQNFVYGRYADNDVSPNSDYLRVQLITEPENYFAYGYYAYPLGSKNDFVRNSELTIDKYWNSTYSYTSKFDNGRWLVTFEIPFSDLRHQGNAPYHWKIILSRYDKHNRQTYSSPFVISKMGNDYFRKAISIEISRKIPNTRLLRINPHAIFNYDIKNSQSEINEENFGLDLTFNPNHFIRSKLSILPDFSDVPMDAVVDTYNSKYPPTYEENRYFFIEDFNVFGTDSNLFYTRNIVQPVYAFKISGSFQNCNFGILSAKDKLEKERIYDAVNDTTYTNVSNPDDYYNILALKPVWDNFRCQFTILNRMNDGYSNSVLHTNPIWEIGKNQYLWFNTNFSQHNLDDKSDYGYHAQFGYTAYSRHDKLKFSFQQMSKNYHLDMGKIYEDDFYGWNFDFENQYNVRSKVVSEIEHSLSLSEEYDNKRNLLLERYLSLESCLVSYFNTDVELEFVYVKENIEPSSDYGKYVDKKRLGLRLEWDKLSWLIQRLSLNKVHYYFYSLKDSHNGVILQYNAMGTLFRHVSYSLALDYSNYDNIPDLPNIDDEYLIGNLDSTINFNNKLSLTLGVRYHNYQVYDITNYYGYYSNIKWEINSKCKFYMGVNAEMNEVDREIEKNYEKFYSKITIIF